MSDPVECIGADLPIRLDNVLGVDVRPGLVDIRGRIIREGVVEAELEGRIERGATARAYEQSMSGNTLLYGQRSDVYWFESTMERFERAQPPTLPH